MGFHASPVFLNHMAIISGLLHSRGRSQHYLLLMPVGKKLAQTQEAAICVARTDLAKYPQKNNCRTKMMQNQQGKCQNSKLEKLKIQQFRFSLQKKVSKWFRTYLIRIIKIYLTFPQNQGNFFGCINLFAPGNGRSILCSVYPVCATRMCQPW